MVQLVVYSQVCWARELHGGGRWAGSTEVGTTSRVGALLNTGKQEGGGVGSR